MIKNLIIIALLVCCGYLLWRSYAPQQPQERFAPAKASAQPPPPPAGGPAQLGARVLRKGMRGPDVAQLQERLTLAGFVRPGFTPGLFDEATEQAVLEYQRGNAFLAEMYGFRGLPTPHKPYVDEGLVRQLQRVPTADKVLIWHTVEPKENLFRIATKFGVGPDAIKYLNGLDESGRLRAGQALVIICDRSKARQ